MGINNLNPNDLIICNQYVRISLLDLNDKPLNLTIEGQTTGGNISVNGSSSMRRTANISLVVDPLLSNVTDVENTISINKRLKLEIGIADGAIASNDIHWYDMGIYQIITPNCNYSTSGLTLSLQLKDKMCLLNGECGGTITNPMIHSPIGVEGPNGQISYEQVTMRNLVYALLDEFSTVGTTDVDLSEIPETVVNIVRWVGAEPLYLQALQGSSTNNLVYYQFATAPGQATLIFGFNEDIGYQEVPYTWAPNNDKELASNPGDTVTSILDKIKNALGNFEYYFDVNGVFQFREIKNGINQGSDKLNLTEAIADAYLVDFSSTEPVYVFDESPLITSYSNNPQYTNIKNDIVCWGTHGKQENAIRYHLLIDSKPVVPTKAYNVYVCTDSYGVKRAYSTESAAIAALPKDADPATAVTRTAIAVTSTSDWREYYYLEYVTTKQENRYKIGRELEEEWPKIYDIEAQTFYWTNILESVEFLNSYTYFIDMLDPADLSGNEAAQKAIEGITITKIGQRTKSTSEKEVNTIFNPMPPKIYYLPTDDPNFISQRAAIIKKILENNNAGDQIEAMEALLQVNEAYAKDMEIGTVSYSAYDCIRTELNSVLGYSETISLSCIPIFDLEPNTRIRVKNEETHIDGDFMINSLSIPLAPNGTMSISASRIIERI